MNISEKYPTLAVQVIESYFAKFRGGEETTGSQAGSAEASALLLKCLAEVELWSGDERLDFYLSIVEGNVGEQPLEARHGDLAFEALVELARMHEAYEMKGWILNVIRSHAPALVGLGFSQCLDLAYAVIKSCRERHAPHRRPPSFPPELVAPALSRSEAADVALRFLCSVYEKGAATQPERTANLEHLIAATASLDAATRKRLARDVAEGLDVMRPKRCRSKSKARQAEARERLRAYERNARAALDVAIADFHRDGYTAEDVVHERAYRLAGVLDVTVERAFGYLWYLAKRSRNA
jgi:hypothetical protein